MKILCKKAFILLFLNVVIFNVSYSISKDNQTAIAIEKYKGMTPQILLDRGDLFSNNDKKDSALICYSLIYNSHFSKSDIISQQITCEALNKAAAIHIYNSNYKLALDFLLRSVGLCNDIGYKEYIGRVYNNIGSVYYRLNDYKSAKKYYRTAYNNIEDSDVLGSILNNLGMIASMENKLDSALLLYKKAFSVKSRANSSTYNGLLNNIGVIQESLKEYDSAFVYYRAALKNAIQLKAIDKEASILSNIGLLQFELGNIDSATYYLEKSNFIARKNKLLSLLSDNYMSFSKIEEKQGNTKRAFDYYKKSYQIKDSLFSVSEYTAINELEFAYRMMDVDEHIKELSIEQTIKERTIIMQRRLQFGMGFALIIVIVVLIILYLKNRTLNTAYKALASRNIEIVKSDDLNHRLRVEYEQQLKEKDGIIKKMRREMSVSEYTKCETIEPTKYKGSSLSDDYKSELMAAILKIMNDKSVFCDPDFSQNKLADMVNSNATYISQIINDSFKTNFRSFLNEYRMKEARRILSDMEYKKYSIEAVAMMVGFKSRDTFDNTFKKVIGVTPSFYVKSLKDY